MADTSRHTMTARRRRMVVAVLMFFLLKRRLRRRRFWVHPILQSRFHLGAFEQLYPDLRANPEKFLNYFRLTTDEFDDVLQKIETEIYHQDTNFRRAVTPTERLSVTLRYLASGNSFTSVAYEYRLGISTVHEVVLETCSALWSKLRYEVMSPPSSEDDWITISRRFAERWNFPNCIGALDGKHVVIQSPQTLGHNTSTISTASPLC